MGRIGARPLSTAGWLLGLLGQSPEPVVRNLARIGAGLDDCLFMGNLDLLRNWGHARAYVEMQWRRPQQHRRGGDTTGRPNKATPSWAGGRDGGPRQGGSPPSNPLAVEQARGSQS
ncbi:MAG: hypothetical protein EA413_08645 [Cyanobium sp. PLM2.Bin73]|nr:MAG: hypothetical protein EA413_08645 [Cyanobium sp. PLM2.Bin73]